MKQLLKALVPERIRTPLLHWLCFAQRRIALEWFRRYGNGAFYCPVCEEKVGRFNPMSPDFFQELRQHGFDMSEHEFETFHGPQYSCPWCESPDRSRLYALYLSERLAGLPGHFKLVDFAPSAPLRQWIKDSFQICYRSADLIMEHVDDRVDLTDMVIYPDASVDAFICSHILEHIPNDTKAMRELFRILKPGGWGILMVPICLRQREVFEDLAKATTEADRWHHFGQGDHVRIYSKQGFIDRVSSLGFIIQQYGVAHFGEDTFRRCGIAQKSVLYVVEKHG